MNIHVRVYVLQTPECTCIGSILEMFVGYDWFKDTCDGNGVGWGGRCGLRTPSPSSCCFDTRCALVVLFYLHRGNGDMFAVRYDALDLRSASFLLDAVDFATNVVLMYPVG